MGQTYTELNANKRNKTNMRDFKIKWLITIKI